MIKLVFLACLSITLVVSNPVSNAYSNQYVDQPTPFTSSAPASPYQAVASQISPFTQHTTVQNQPTVHGNSDGTNINDLLMSKILKNPCLQKILDPNTKLYNQNGREVQRQANAGPTPSVVNNYFIVPPEFFNINNNQTEGKLTSEPKKRKKSDRKENLSKNKTKPNVSKDKNNNDILKDAESVNSPKNNVQTKKRGKKRKSKPAKMVEHDFGIDAEKDSKKPETEVNITRKRKKTEKSKNIEPVEEISSLNGSPEIETSEKKNYQPVTNINESKKRKNARKESQKIPAEKKIPISQENVALKCKKNKTSSDDKQSKMVLESEDSTCLKDIESPVDNNETENVEEHILSTKRVKENRKTRNPNTNKVKKESNSPMPEDMMKNFFPYMYTGSNFYPNGNYPFNFDQLYQPHTKKNKKNKNNEARKSQNTKESLPKVVEVHVNLKKNKNTAAAKPMNEDSPESVKLDSSNMTTTVKPIEEKNKDKKKLGSVNVKTNIESADPIIDIPTKPKKEELKIETNSEHSKPGSIVTKANLKMPPTMIEDLHHYIDPDLESEDIVRTIHTNGIINDYYPIFYDDSLYDKDENYYLRDLEDERHFYTTDRSFEEPLSRDRRKYDKHEDYHMPNSNNKDRMNIRRTYKFKESEQSKFDNDNKNYRRMNYPDKNIDFEGIKQEHNIEEENVKHINDIEDQFQTPPLLENPDFITTKIKTVYPKSDKHSFELTEPIYTDSVEKISDYNTYPDPKPTKYSRLTNYDDDVKKNDKNLANNKPRSDRIETVFAKTRVVKYGVGKDAEENTSSSPLFDDDEEKFYRDGHTTYIMAKSLGESDDYVW